MRKTFVFLLPILLTGCVTMSPEAERVQVHHQESNLLQDCKKLGPVSALYAYPFSVRQAEAEAEVKLRQDTYNLHGDTVAILNMESGIARVSMQGVAYKCYP